MGSSSLCEARILKCGKVSSIRYLRSSKSAVWRTKKSIRARAERAA
jgi:hypothetical protein